ncbi:MAG TPA: hypothetical protein VEJ88_00375 [Dissulfurispiraceae bacterium]|nr:hypothetical protein [Dissulfurispiraceae bacterium]
MYREVLLADINRDIASIKREVEAIKPKIERLTTDKDPVNYDSHKRAIGSCLVSIYTGIEKIIERIIKTVDGFMPETKQYHQALLDRAATPIPGKRPALISEQTYELLQEMKGFRHLYTHIYHYNLLPLRLKELAEKGPIVCEAFFRDIEAFQAGLPDF